MRKKTRPIVADALRPLYDKGPGDNPAFRYNYSAIVAGTDPVALDRICMGVLDEERHLDEMKSPLEPLSPYLAHAAELGLGEGNLANINVVQSG